MQVQVTLIEGGAGGGRDGREEVGRRGVSATTEQMVEEGAVETKLDRTPCQPGKLEETGEKRTELTCQVNGRLLMFTNASARTRTLTTAVQLGGPYEATSKILLSTAITIVSAVVVVVELVVEEEEENVTEEFI